MKITKTIKEYVEKCVREKVYKKYEAEAAEANRRYEEIQNFFNNLGNTMKEYIEKQAKIFIEEHPYAKIVTREKMFFLYNPIDIIDCSENSVHGWLNRADAEIKEKVVDIVVALELGGTKADLDRMLDEI